MYTVMNGWMTEERGMDKQMIDRCSAERTLAKWMYKRMDGWLVGGADDVQKLVNGLMSEMFSWKNAGWINGWMNR